MRSDSCRTRRRRFPGLTLGLAAFVCASSLASCAINPATGDTQLSLIGEGQEIEMGRQAHESVVGTMGLYQDESLQNFVSELGREMAAISERPDLPWTFGIVDEPGVNAFALPGGFVYVTRGILSHFNSEAQLAAVLGHEIGHVTARHSVNQMSRQQLASLGLGIGSILSSEVAQFQGLISAGLQIAFLSFSREDERESDDLGLRYMTAVGYDPTEMPDVFRMLSSASGGEGAGPPEWLSTHPNPENREQRIQEQIAELEMNPDTLVVDRDEYMGRLDGMVFGDDPRNGWFQGSTFLHPELRFQMTFPRGWQTVNQRQQVLAQPQDGGAVAGLTLADASSPDEALRGFLQQEGLEAGPTERRRINGHSASWGRFAVQTEEAALGGLVAFVAYDGRVYQLMGYTSENQYGSYQDAFQQTFMSFDGLSDRDALSVEPKRIRIVSLPGAMTLREFNERNPSTISLDRLAVINQVDPGQALAAGRLVKRVTGEGAPGSP